MRRLSGLWYVLLASAVLVGMSAVVASAATGGDPDTSPIDVVTCAVPV